MTRGLTSGAGSIEIDITDSQDALFDFLRAVFNEPVFIEIHPCGDANFALGKTIQIEDDVFLITRCQPGESGVPGWMEARLL